METLKSEEHKGYLVISQPNPRGDAGWGAYAAILRLNPTPMEFKDHVFLDETYATRDLAHKEGIKEAKRRIDADDLP